jgi:predicted metalloprotease
MAPLRRPLLALLLAAAAAGGVGGCGSDDAQSVADDVRQEVRERRERLEQELRERRDRLRDRIDEVLGELERAFPRAETTSPQVQSRGSTEANTIDGYMTRVIESVDRYWTRTLRASDLPEPRVTYSWIPPGGRQDTRCGIVADDNAAFYCPADDTIYVAQRFAAALWEGVASGLPGQQAGFGRAAGDFGVAYVIAHEYAHNLQQELGLFTIGRANSTKPFELQADCMAGAWGAAVFAEGRVSREDVQEAINTALAVGDFDVSSRNHHGTPEERRNAWLTGFESNDPAACRQFVPA